MRRLTEASIEVMTTRCSDQPSHSQEQAEKRVALEDLRGR